MNIKTLAIVLIVATAFFFGWRLNRQPTSHEQPKEISEATSLTEQTIPAQPEELPTQTALQSKDVRMSTIADIIGWRDQRIADVLQNAKGFETEADRREIAKIQQESERQLKAILTEDENYNLLVEKLKGSALGKALVEHYAASDIEFAAISDYEKDLAEVLATSGGDLEDVQSRGLTKLKAIIGEERTQEFMNYHDPDYVESLAFLKRFNLPPETSTALLKLKVEYGKIVLERIKQRQPVSSPSLGEIFRPRVTELLGAEPAETYVREAKGAGWLR